MRKAAFLLLLALLPVPAMGEVSAKSPTCGPVRGKTEKDRDHVLHFCKFVPKDTVLGARADEMLLWVHVPKGMAYVMRADPLTTKQLVKKWMGLWRNVTGAGSVRVTIVWGEVEVAVGQTTFFSGDQVTLP